MDFLNIGFNVILYILLARHKALNAILKFHIIGAYI
jgi:hypothetical protein